MTERAPDWLHGDRLARVWGLVGDALERRSLEARGSVGLDELTRDERHALSDVLGRPVTGESLRLRLDELGERIHTRTGHELAPAVTWVTGRELVDRADRRRAATARRERPLDLARAWLDDPGREWSGEGGVPPAWVGRWLDGLRRDGVLTSMPDSGVVVLSALRVLEHRGVFHESAAQGDRAGDEDDEVPWAGPRSGVIARTELAARHTGSAHGLDDGTKLSLVVLRAAAARSGTHLPRTGMDRRRLWESLGVVADRVSTSCLTWGLRPVGGPGGISRPTAAISRGPGAPWHVTWWDLEAGLEWAPAQRVLVCENPRTLEAIAESQGPDRLGVVCTMGRGNLVVAEVLTRLVGSNARLRYHGDFDWPGLVLANACAKDYGAEPWLMSAEDYLAAPGSHPLVGRPTEADWDAELSAAMRARGVAVHEEAVLDQLLERLSEIG